mgnify:CR=1 FL=1
MPEKLEIERDTIRSGEFAIGVPPLQHATDAILVRLLSGTRLTDPHSFASLATSLRDRPVMIAMRDSEIFFLGKVVVLSRHSFTTLRA